MRIDLKMFASFLCDSSTFAFIFVCLFLRENIEHNFVETATSIESMHHHYFSILIILHNVNI